MNRVAREACALAGPGFVLRPLLLRGAGIPKAHLGARARDQETQIRSLMPLRDLSVRFRPLLVVDDIVSSGATLRAAAELLSVYNEAHGRWGLALARTAAQLRDHAKAELLRL
jgi:predicted amidophosphoribosyltransferase